MAEDIIESINKIAAEKGDDYVQVLVAGINVGMVLGAMKSPPDTECEVA